MSVTQPMARADFAHVHELAPQVTSALQSIGIAVKKSGLDPLLMELVKIRVSQVNGCAFCVNMHFGEARQAGETEERLQLLCVWHEVTVFTERERAALAWAEALTLVTEGHVPDEVYTEANEYFSEQELANLTGLIVVMNAWNRIGIGYRFAPQLASKQ